MKSDREVHLLKTLKTGNRKAGLLLVLTTLTGQLCAAEPRQEELKISQISATATLHVQARQIAVSQILSAIAAATHLNLHYPAGLADKNISGNCMGSLREVIECFLGAPQNTVVRFAADGKPEEAWIMTGVTDSKNLITTSPVDPEIAEDVEEAKAVEELLEHAQSKDTEQRLQALAELPGHSFKDKALVKKVLDEALSDANKDIRGKAVASLVRIDKEGSRAQIQQMLTDDEVSVRLNTVSAAYNDKQILTQALNDSNDLVRLLAETNLKRLDKPN